MSNKFWNDRVQDDAVSHFWIRALKIAAIAIGVWGALYPLGGDRDPEAVGIAPAPTSEYVSMAYVHEHVVSSTGDITFFELRFGTDGNGGVAVVSMDNDLALAKWLSEHRGDRVQLVVRDLTPLTRGGQARHP